MMRQRRPVIHNLSNAMLVFCFKLPSSSADGQQSESKDAKSIKAKKDQARQVQQQQML